MTTTEPAASAAPVVLVCPCCASPVDADPGPQEQEFACTICAQTWAMVVEADRHHTYAL